MTKNQCRSVLIEKRKRIPQDKKKYWDNQIFARLSDLDLLRQADSLLVYVSKRQEVDTHRLIDFWLSKCRTLATPRCEGEEMAFYKIKGWADLHSGQFGVLEPNRSCKPVLATEQSVCILPGLGFSDQGARLGYGKGYYDRFLKQFPGKTIGVCYECCKRTEIPTEDHDQPVDVVVTEKSLIYIKER